MGWNKTQFGFDFIFQKLNLNFILLWSKLCVFDVYILHFQFPVMIIHDGVSLLRARE